MLPSSIAVFGASSVYGIGDNEHGGYVLRLREAFDQNSTQEIVYDLGIPAETTIGLLERVETELHSRSPAIVLFQIGSNDSAIEHSPTGRSQVSLDDFRSNIADLILIGRKTSLVGFITSTPVDETKNPHDLRMYYTNERIKQYHDALIQICTKHTIPVLDVFSEFLKDPNYLKYVSNDGLHLDEEGHGLVAKLLIEFVTTQFQTAR